MIEISVPTYIDQWISVIENMKNENTYKLAWGRALVECVFHDRYEKDYIRQQCHKFSFGRLQNNYDKKRYFC